jgi:hypothetical protein
MNRQPKQPVLAARNLDCHWRTTTAGTLMKSLALSGFLTRHQFAMFGGSHGTKSMLQTNTATTCTASGESL